MRHLKACVCTLSLLGIASGQCDEADVTRIDRTCKWGGQALWGPWQELHESFFSEALRTETQTSMTTHHIASPLWPQEQKWARYHGPRPQREGRIVRKRAREAAERGPGSNGRQIASVHET